MNKGKGLSKDKNGESSKDQSKEKIKIRSDGKVLVNKNSVNEAEIPTKVISFSCRGRKRTVKPEIIFKKKLTQKNNKKRRDTNEKINYDSKKMKSVSNLRKKQKLKNIEVEKELDKVEENLENEDESQNSEDEHLDRSRSVSPINNYYITENDGIICKTCHQDLSKEVKFYCGELSHGTTEDVTILDPRLSLFNGLEEDLQNEDARAYDKITCFSVYCEAGHLCPFDSGLIEKDKNIYFSGYVKPIYSEDPSVKDGVPGKDFGPIVEWWTTGFDIGEKPTIGLRTALGDYILMEPAVQYAPYMKNAITKIFISKTIIEYLVYKPNATFKELLSKLQQTPIPNCPTQYITKEDLIRHGSFICNQIMSFDSSESADPNEQPLIKASCIRHLMKLAHVNLNCNISKKQTKKVKQK